MIKAIVTDIEGTTSSLSFVKDVLFPYAKENLPEYVMALAGEADVAEQLELVNKEVGRNLSLSEAIQQLQRWIDEDKKIAPLKNLQGMIWESGYVTEDFTGHVYEDAARNLSRWHEQGVKLYVYSSGSVKAQQLLFGFSDFDDLSVLFSGHFDTGIGQKQEIESYNKIVTSLQLPADEILFLSDIKQELDAAKAAGLHTCWLVRDSDELDGLAEHAQVKSFDDITLSQY
ncbi:MAG: acireductone synthase [Gammaproteobacteria bacterium]|nr:acireductone synthase [Gammaproteobacteria bacterium]